MKILFYCQHVLGIGHFFRSLELCRALDRHRVTLVTGGPSLEVRLPGHVDEVKLPELGMDPAFTELRAAAGAKLEAVQRLRRERLMDLFTAQRPDLFLVELYPFGRKAFRFEIQPVLEAIARQRPRRCGVLCSLRDILVEKKRQERYEARVTAEVNRHFDAVLVHADPRLVRLEDTFRRVGDLAVPVVYTGFITPAPAPDARRRLRTALGLSDSDRLVLASAGGGSVGGPLLEAVVAAFRRLSRPPGTRLQVFTGPFLPAEDFRRLMEMAGGSVAVERFTSDFPSWLAAADLSVSMAGYNTTMNLLAAGVPALVWPFARNREQGLRSARLAALGALDLLQDRDLDPGRLAGILEGGLGRPRRPGAGIDLDGARATARWLEDWSRNAAWSTAP